MISAYFDFVKSLNKSMEDWDQYCKNKSGLIYEVIDKSEGFYRPYVAKNSRSRINATFDIKGDPQLTQKFCDLAGLEGLVELHGHRKVGGIRASMYNPIPIAACEKLREFMYKFQENHQNM